jgi:hypothetical protein
MIDGSGNHLRAAAIRLDELAAGTCRRRWPSKMHSNTQQHHFIDTFFIPSPFLVMFLHMPPCLGIPLYYTTLLQTELTEFPIATMV